MTEKEEVELVERLNKAGGIKSEITSIKDFLEAGKTSGSIYVTLHIRDGRGFKEVCNLSSETRNDLIEAVAVALKNRLYELEEEYGKV